MFEKLFEEIGLQDKESKVYLALSELGKARASQISQKASMPRATVYGILGLLVEKGVVSQEQGRSGTTYLVNDPHSFVRLVDAERATLSSKERAAKELAQLLSPYVKSKQFGVPRIQLFEGKQSIENMLYDYLPLWRESYAHIGDSTLWGYQDHTFVESYVKWHYHMWQTRSDREKICLFSNRADVEKELLHKIPRREVRALPEGVQFSSSIWIYGEYLIMAMTRQKPQYAFQMKDPLLASNLRTIFQLLWKAKF